MSIDGSEISDGSNDTLVALKPIKNNFEFISIENGDIVELSAVENANKVWVRAVKHDDLYEKLLSEINVSSTFPVDEIEKDTVVLVKYSGDYSRGIVVYSDADADAVTIRLMDIGCKINVKKGKGENIEKKSSKFLFLICEFSYPHYPQRICEKKCPIRFLRKEWLYHSNSTCQTICQSTKRRP